MTTTTLLLLAAILCFDVVHSFHNILRSPASLHHQQRHHHSTPITQLQLGADNPWASPDEEDPTVDMFGDKIGAEFAEQDEKYLAVLRYNKTIANDRWQSNIFREAHCGKWQGMYEVYVPRLVNGALSLAIAAHGVVDTSMEASPQVFEGVNITYSEVYTPGKEAASASAENKISPLLVSATRSSIDSREFRSTSGNQVSCCRWFREAAAGGG
jgi:hypothetical protein